MSNENKRMKSEKMMIGIIIALVILLVPLIIDYLIIGNKVLSNISNSEWVGFLGSYIGGIIGSISTLIGIFITINFTKQQAEIDRENARSILREDIKFAREQAQEDRRLSVMPYLKLTLSQKNLIQKF